MTTQKRPEYVCKTDTREVVSLKNLHMETWSKETKLIVEEAGDFRIVLTDWLREKIKGDVKVSV